MCSEVTTDAEVEGLPDVMFEGRYTAADEVSH